MVVYTIKFDSDDEDAARQVFEYAKKVARHNCSLESRTSEYVDHRAVQTVKREHHFLRGDDVVTVDELDAAFN